jgi:flagellar motor switch protein FliM
MTDTLDADRIAALFEAAGQQARTPEEADAAAGRRPRWLRTVDFSRPTKFTTDQERRLTRAIEAFCRTGSTRLSAERVPIELELLDCSQHTWTNASAQVPGGSVVAQIDLTDLGTHIVLTAEHPLLLGALESLLGGSAERAPKERKLTDIDLGLIRRVFDALTEALSGVFMDNAGVTLALRNVDATGEIAWLEQPSEPTLALTMEARLGRASTVMVLLLPYSSVEPILARFTGRDDGSDQSRDAGSVEAVRAGVSRVDVTVRAEVADRRMPIRDVLALRPGDVVKLGSAAGSAVTLFAEDVPVHVGRPGRSGNRRAVQVIAPVEPPS